GGKDALARTVRSDGAVLFSVESFDPSGFLPTSWTEGGVGPYTAAYDAFGRTIRRTGPDGSASATTLAAAGGASIADICEGREHEHDLSCVRVDYQRDGAPLSARSQPIGFDASARTLELGYDANADMISAVSRVGPNIVERVSFGSYDVHGEPGTIVLEDPLL